MTNKETPVQTLDQVLATATPLRVTVRLCLNGLLLDTLEQVTDAADWSDAHGDPNLEERLREVLDLTRQVREAETVFTFQSIGRKAWRDLLAEHPPSEEHQKAGGDFDPSTFPAVAMAAAVVEPAGTSRERFERLAVQMTDGQWNTLWKACHAANTGSGAGNASAYALRAQRRLTEVVKASAEAS